MKKLGLVSVLGKVIFILWLTTTEGTFIHGSSLKNRYYELEKRIGAITVMEVSECEAECEGNEMCSAFAVDAFSLLNCILYNPSKAEKPIYEVGYNLYVSIKTEDQGYYFDEADEKYIKLILKRMDAKQANTLCKKENGMLAPVMTAKRNDMINGIMIAHSVWKAFIGLTDEKREDDWRTLNGRKLKFSNWAEDGKWENDQSNCAVIDIIGKWAHEDCYNHHYFFCEIPLF